MNLAIASGKGGTGKTTVAVNLALFLSQEEKVEFLDCDVEEPNAHLFIKPKFAKVKEVGIPNPVIDFDKCDFCGRCADVCAFNALAVLQEHVMVLPELCHGCGSCTYFCPQKAISEDDRTIGVIESGRANRLDFVHGCLNPGEAISPPLIDAVKKMANRDEMTIIDAPPGTSCPAISAIKGSDFCILVTEPTPFGLNDLDLVNQTVIKLGVPAGVVINRCDIGDGRVEEYCRKHSLPVLLKIPFDRKVAELYARGEPVVFNLPGWQKSFRQLYDQIRVSAEGAFS
ncbi:MAG: ATP-binding protein [Bacillota bacterium]